MGTSRMEIKYTNILYSNILFKVTVNPWSEKNVFCVE